MANTTIPNGTHYHSWKPEPLVRGTWSIVSSSLLTMILCVWTAVHLNIPEFENEVRRAQNRLIKTQTWRKSGWMIIALLAPEWVLWTAYIEHINAVEIGKVMRKAFDQPKPRGLIGTLSTMLRHFFRSVSHKSSGIGMKTGLTKQPEKLPRHTNAQPETKCQRHPWTHCHSLYATMGGFAIDTRGLGLAYLPGGRQRMTLTLPGLKYISEHHPELIPDIPESEIQDKSKASMFTKVLTCGQALWFGIQCLTRSTQGLSISLLEINTAVHAACALSLYWFFWWNKPLDVEEPTICTNADIHPIAALVTVYQMYPCVQPLRTDVRQDVDPYAISDSGNSEPHPALAHITLGRARNGLNGEDQYLTYQGFAFPTLERRFSYKSFTELDFRRFDLASRADRKINLRVVCLKRAFLSVRSRNRPKIVLSPHQYDTRRLKLGYDRRPHFDTTRSAPTKGFVLAGLFYGSVHLLVWNRPFRHSTDELLWKVSSITILGSGLPYALWCLVMDLRDGVWGEAAQLPVQERPENSWKHAFPQAFHVLDVIVKFVPVLPALFYVLCRTFIIVECFLDVFHLPDSAFEVPRWSQYFPHIG